MFQETFLILHKLDQLAVTLVFCTSIGLRSFVHLVMKRVIAGCWQVANFWESFDAAVCQIYSKEEGPCKNTHLSLFTLLLMHM
jgi:hypothetical protein